MNQDAWQKYMVGSPVFSIPVPAWGGGRIDCQHLSGRVTDCKKNVKYEYIL